MSLFDILAIALASWAIAYHLTFGPLFDWLRTRVGIGFDLDVNGQAVERWGSNSLAAFLNCPTCAAILGIGVVAIIWYNGLEETVRWLAALGLATMVARWWVSQRPKAEWWL